MGLFDFGVFADFGVFGDFGDLGLLALLGVFDLPDFGEPDRTERELGDSNAV